MSTLVVDASIAVKWFIPEQYSINALWLLDCGYELIAPDLIIAEFGNVLWKKWLRGELEPRMVAGLLHDLQLMRVRIVPSTVLAEQTAGIATTYRRSFYDSLYLALAVFSGGRMVTADAKLCNALKATTLEKNILWIEDLPSPR